MFLELQKGHPLGNAPRVGFEVPLFKRAVQRVGSRLAADGTLHIYFFEVSSCLGEFPSWEEVLVFVDTRVELQYSEQDEMAL